MRLIFYFFFGQWSAEAEALILEKANSILKEADLSPLHIHGVLVRAGNWFTTPQLIRTLHNKLKQRESQILTKEQLGQKILVFVRENVSFVLVDSNVSAEQAVVIMKGPHRGKRGIDTLSQTVKGIGVGVDQTTEHNICLKAENVAQGGGEIIQVKRGDFSLDAGSIWLKLAFVAPAQPPAAAPLDKAKLNNKEYLNWIRVGLALRELAELLAQFIHIEAIAYHRTFLAELLELGIARYIGDISLYVPEDVHTDPAMAALKPIADVIKKHHLGKEPTWSNSNAAKWCDQKAGFFEVIKLYCAPMGRHDAAIKKEGASDVDFCSLAAMLMWCDRFECRSDSPSECKRKQLIRAVSLVRNAWAHNQRTEFSNTDTDKHLCSLCTLLQQETNLVSLPTVQETLQRLVEIRDRNFSVMQVQHDELVHVRMLQALERRLEQEQEQHTQEKTKRVKAEAGKQEEREKRKQTVATARDTIVQATGMTAPAARQIVPSVSAPLSVEDDDDDDYRSLSSVQVKSAVEVEVEDAKDAKIKAMEAKMRAQAKKLRSQKEKLRAQKDKMRAAGMSVTESSIAESSDSFVSSSAPTGSTDCNDEVMAEGSTEESGSNRGKGCRAGYAHQMNVPTARLKLTHGTQVKGVITYIVCADEEQGLSLKGGQGLVIKVCNATGTYFAMKQPNDLSRLRGQAREAQVYFNLDPNKHVHLAFLVDVVRYKGVPLLVLEWADKGSLEQWLAQEHPLLEAVELAIQLARGLQSLHLLCDSEGKPQPMVHKDLKPGNVLLFGAVLKLIDFGLCCSAAGNSGAEGGGSGLGTVDTVGGGTLKWMAPEQLLQWVESRRRRRQTQTQRNSKRKPEPSWDMWAFGLLVASMLNSEMTKAVQEYQRRALGSVDMDDEKMMEQAAAQMPSIALEEIVGKAAALASSTEDASTASALSTATELLRQCFDADTIKRASAMDSEEQLQQVYALLTGTRYPSSEHLSIQWREASEAATRADVTTVFKAREREARFYQLVLGDTVKEVELLEEQLSEELRDALQLKIAKTDQQAVAALDVKGMRTALDAGTAAAEVLGTNTLWLRMMGNQLAKDQLLDEDALDAFVLPRIKMGLPIEATYAEWMHHKSISLAKRNKLLPVLLDWVIGASRLHSEVGADGSNANMPLLVGLVEQLQEVWKDSKHGDGKTCCSHQLGSTGDSESPFQRLCTEGVAELVQWVLASARARDVEGGAGRESTGTLMAPNPANGTTPLYTASYTGHAAVVTALLEQDGIDVDQQCMHLMLFHASAMGHVSVVQVLLRHERIDVNQATTHEPVPTGWSPANGCTPLMMASQHGHVAVVQALLEHEGTDVNQASTERGCTPLFMASQHGHVAVVQALLQREGIDANQATTDLGCTPLYMASYHGHVEVVQALLEHEGVDVNQARIDDGRTPLISAALQGNQQCVQLLLAAGADRHRHTVIGHTAFALAKMGGHESIAVLLDDRPPLLVMASQEGDVAVVRALLQQEGNDVNQAHAPSGCTPLYMASQQGHTAVVQALLEQEGVDVNQAHAPTGCTPLYMASQQGHVAVVQALLEHGGVAVNQARTLGCTPLMIAVLGGHELCVQLLLAAGADRTVITVAIDSCPSYTAGKIAFDLAKELGHESIAALLAGEHDLLVDDDEDAMLQVALAMSLQQQPPHPGDGGERDMADSKAGAGGGRTDAT
jgi:ankyrin repeat protein/serine/threonine protein kinase